jgi:farnesol dehydrogenase
MAQGKIYVTGASGRLGREVLKEIPDAIPLVRKPSGLKNEVVTDFSPDSLQYVLRDASAIIHLAASRDFLDEKKAREGNVYLTYQVVDEAPKSAKIIFTSSISVYGKRLAKIPADENTELRPDTPYARTKLEAEKIVAARPSHVILRVGPIYGPGFEEYSKVLSMLKEGKMRLIGEGSNHIPFVHVDDVVAVIKGSLSRGQGTYLVVGECLTQKEIFSIAATELGVQPPAKSTSPILAMAAAQFNLMKSSFLGGRPKFIPEDVAVLSSDRVFDCTKAKSELGFSPRPISEGIKEMVRLMGKENEKPKEAQESIA